MNRVRHGTTVVNYRAELAELKSSFAQLTAQRNREQKKATKLHAELNAIKSKASKQQALIKSLHRRNNSLAETNQRSEKQLKAAAERIRRLEAKLVCNYQQKRSTGSSANHNSAEDTERRRRQLADQAAQLERQAEQINTYEATIEATVEEIDVLSRALRLKVGGTTSTDASTSDGNGGNGGAEDQTIQCTLLFELARAQKDLQHLEERLREKTDQVDRLLSELQNAQVQCMCRVAAGGGEWWVHVRASM